MLRDAHDALRAKDARTFELRLKRPFPLMLDVLGKPNAPVPFILPERLARTPGDQRITEIVGSGPFRFRAGPVAPRQRHGAGELRRLRAARGGAGFSGRRQAREGGQPVAARHAGPGHRHDRAAGQRDRLPAIRALRLHPAARARAAGEAAVAGRAAPVPGQFPPEPRRAAFRRPGGAPRAVEAGGPEHGAAGHRHPGALPRAAMPVLLDVRRALQHASRRRGRAALAGGSAGANSPRPAIAASRCVFLEVAGSISPDRGPGAGRRT